MSVNNDSDDDQFVFYQGDKQVQIDALGSLGLLAIGYRGLLAWRKVRDQVNKQAEF